MRHLAIPAIVLLVLSAGCAAATRAAGGSPDVTGSVRVSGPALGSAVIAPLRCQSGEHQLYLGAEFVAPAGPLAVRLVVDPLSGPAVRVLPRQTPLAPGLIFQRKDCTRFDLTLERTRWRINDIWQLRVRLDLECSLPSGDAVAGSLASSGCV